ncbi:hypothetical protein FB45DRAFT_1112673 [Roridomyces roridus]|uniref:F-box domain-containing protein n=1 Tax=Roridomyces roridus TaxID=1738132 RepID=A0AAD7FAX2_9AGAR|nr:hypothetical protein FB45DRAFT_1112673 [Roridomyces roridus]
MFSSVHTLRRRVNSLVDAIERQKDVLRNLERQCSDAQSELNALLDPMARLPIEIASDILLQAIPTRPTWDSLLIFLRVCRAWSNLAVATPFLWSTITDSGIPQAQFATVLEKWLSLARGLPLSLILRNAHPSTFPDTLQTLDAHTPRIQSMDLSPLHDEDLRLMTHTFDGLTSLTIYRSRIPSDLCVELLRRAPNLVELSFVEVQFHAASMPRHLTHPTLQHLHFRRPDTYYYSDTAIIQFLTLPALQSLFLSRSDITEEELLDFLARSAPPLRQLHVRLQEDDVCSEAIVASLRLVPELTHLEVIHPDSEYDYSTFDLWAHDPYLLPALRNLTIADFYYHGLEGYRRVLDFLAKRRASLRSLQLIVPGEVLDDATAAALRVFQDEGMDIHVDTGKEDLFSMFGMGDD